MSKYIGTPVVSLSTDTVDVTGDITTTDATPEVIIVNDTHEDTDGGREGKVTFKGQQSGGEETTLAEIQASHDGTSDDEKGDLIFKTNDGSDGASPTEALRISSDAHVGIGENDPKADLVVKQSGSTFTPNANTVALFQRNTATGSGAMVSILSGNNSAADLNFADADDEDIGRIRYNHSDNSMQFQTNTAERMRIDSSGNLGIGTAAPLRQLHIHNTSANSEIAFTAGTSGVSSILFGDGQTGTDVYRGYVQYNHADDNMLFGIGAVQTLSLNSASNSFGLDFVTLSSPYGMRVRANGSFSHQEGLYLADHSNNLKWKANMDGSTSQVAAASATAFNATSDYRLKENIEDLTDGITKVKQLQPKKYNWISDKTDTLEDGFIAHEVATVVPSVVRGSKDGVVVWQEGEELPDGVSLGDNKLDDDGNTIPEYQGIEYGKLVPVLTKALQEAIAKIETLETKVAALEGE